MPVPLGSDPQSPEALRWIDCTCQEGRKRMGLALAEAAKHDARTAAEPAIHKARITVLLGMGAFPGDKGSPLGLRCFVPSNRHEPDTKRQTRALSVRG